MPNLCCSICEALPVPVNLKQLQSIIAGKRTIILGSAPSAHDDLRGAYQGPSDCLICVNGSVSAVDRDIPIDILLLNSRDTHGWDPASRRLHNRMMRQLANRHIKHIIFLMKNKSPQGTLDKLTQMGTSWDSYDTICSMPKIGICQSVGVKRWKEAFDTSAGVFAACLAVFGGGKPVVLCGISFEDGYCYFPSGTILTNTRKHRDPDRYALLALAGKHPQTLLVEAQVASAITAQQLASTSIRGTLTAT